MNKAYIYLTFDQLYKRSYFSMAANFLPSWEAYQTHYKDQWFSDYEGLDVNLLHQGSGHYKHCQNTHHTVLIQLIYLLPFRLWSTLWYYRKGRERDWPLQTVCYLPGTQCSAFHRFNSNFYLCIKNRLKIVRYFGNRKLLQS